MARARFFLWGSLVAAVLSFVFFAKLGGDERRPGDRCLECHAKLFETPKRFQHAMITERRCDLCHTDYDEEAHRERTKPTLETCQDCHSAEKLGRSHPVGGGILDPNTGGTMTCVSCHLPHGSDYRYQTAYANNKDLCLSCHRDF